MKRNKETQMKRCAWLLMTLVLCAGAAQAEVTVSRVFGSHMVLQRDIDVPVWGWADPGETVTVEFAGQKKAVKANKAGKWMVRLAPMDANAIGQPMTVTDAKSGKKITLDDVLIGEVWICSGQSNMQWTVGSSKALLHESIKAANLPLIRHIRVDGRFSTKKAKDLQPNAAWKVCTPETVGGFTGAGFFFARKINKETGLPVGLIHSSVGGTRIEPWTPAEGFAAVKELPTLKKQTANADVQYRKAVAKSVAENRKWIADTEKALATGGKLYKPTIAVHPLDSGAKPSMLFNPKINPVVPYAIRGAIWYQGEANGNEGLSYVHKKRALVEGWREVWGQKEAKSGGPQRDFPFYWVQLANWRSPNENPEGGDGWAKVRMAQAKAMKIKNTGMAVAIELADEGNPNDIHPKNKLDVGERLALWALAKDYGKDVVYSGPIYKSMTVKGNKAILHFDHTAPGLMVGEKSGILPVKEVKGGTLKRFAISDGKGWHWANAKIVGDTVVVSCKDVPKPTAVRYAYTMNPAGCNLYNKAGLPASPFTTDGLWK